MSLFFISYLVHLKLRKYFVHKIVSSYTETIRTLFLFPWVLGVFDVLLYKHIHGNLTSLGYLLLLTSHREMHGFLIDEVSDLSGGCNIVLCICCGFDTFANVNHD